MHEYVLSCGSTVDLTEKRLAERNILCFPFHFILDGKEYDDDFGKSLSYAELYKALADGKTAKTSQINTDEYVCGFEPVLKEGKDLIHVVLSSGITGSYNSALRAKAILGEKYPERRIFVVDALCISSGYGMLMELAADKRDAGASAEEVVEYIEGIKKRIHHLFFSTDLTQYIKGGRVSPVAGMFGTLLKICPLLYINAEGKLVVEKKCMGKKRAMNEMMGEMLDRIDGGRDYNGKCYLCHSQALADAEIFRNMVEEHFPALAGKCEIYDIGATIGCHSGAGTVAVFFVGKERV